MSSATARRRVVLAVLTSMIGALLAVLGVAGPANATHYRATQITWHKHAGAGANEVEFHATASWRCSFFFSGCPAPGTTFFADPIQFGDGTWSTSLWTVTSSDSSNDVLTAQMQESHTYTTSGPYTAYLDSCCRLSGPNHVNNPDGELRAETLVDTAATTASPVSSISPIVDCALDAVCQFFVPGADPDGQALRWRFSTSAEAGFGFTQPGPPDAANAATIDPTTGLYRWDTTGAALSSSGSTFYSTQVVIENLATGGAVISRTAVDFFIRLSSNTANQPPVFTAPTPADGTTLNVSVGDPVTFGVAATDPDSGDTVSLAMLGKPATATYSTTAGNPASGTFNWTADAPGTVILTLTAQDQNGLGATQRSVTINVAPSSTNQPPEVHAGGPYTGDEGEAIPISGSATDTDGDDVTTTWSVTSDSGNDAGAACVVDDPASLNTSLTCNDDGTYTLKLEGADGNGGTDDDTTTVTVGNLNPSVEITVPVDGALFPVGGSVNLSADVDDPGGNDEVTCTTTWDDGSSADAGGESVGVCSASHTYSSPGVYVIEVAAGDGDGGSASDTVMIVVYDPSAGFVTGGGWIESAAGSYAADPSLSGRANFGFVSKYKKGAAVPEGQTEFQFHAGSFAFHSEAYQWLVVAGTKAQFKGTGRVNGAAGYGFLVTAYDGGKTGPDKFRIKIWQVSNGMTVYDNKLGSSSDLDSADPQIIGGGSIVIHK